MSLPGVGAAGSLARRFRSILAASFFREALVEQIGDRDAHMRGVGDVGVAYRKAKPRCFQHQMEALRPKRIERGEIEVFQNVEHHQRGEPLPVRRNLNEIEPAVIGRDRSYGITAMAREILRGEERAARRYGRRHVGGDLALVEGARALGGDGLERRGQRGKPDHVAFLGRRAVEQIMLGRARIGFELADIPLPIPRHARRHRKATLGVFDRG